MNNAARETCYRCVRPVAMCVCAVVPSVKNRTGLHILQHRHERRHPIGTARLLRLGLQGVELHMLSPRHDDGTCPPVPLPAGCGLLYPSPDAIDLATVSVKPEQLVVLDGTWSQAHRLYRDNAWIRALPHYRINPSAPGRYRIRKEPRLECLSTLEAAVQAIELIEPELEGLDGLINAFDRMIDEQVRVTRESLTPGRAPRRRAKVVTERPVFTRPDRVIVVHLERVTAGLPGLPGVLQLAAASLATGEALDLIITHDAPLGRHHQAQLLLSDRDLADGVPLTEAVARFVAFCGDAPILATWTTGARDALASLDLPGAEHVLMKAVWANKTRARVPALEAIVPSLGLVAPSLPVRGRAAGHLEHALALARHLADDAR